MILENDGRKLRHMPWPLNCYVTETGVQPVLFALSPLPPTLGPATIITLCKNTRMDLPASFFFFSLLQCRVIFQNVSQVYTNHLLEIFPW